MNEEYTGLDKLSLSPWLNLYKDDYNLLQSVLGTKLMLNNLTNSVRTDSTIYGRHVFLMCLFKEQ
jgi:hypothetical protein